jgi:hypothetical protein
MTTVSIQQADGDMLAPAQFVNWLASKFEDEPAMFAAFRLDEFTVVAARGSRGWLLEQFVEDGLGGTVQVAGEVASSGGEAA